MAAAVSIAAPLRALLRGAAYATRVRVPHAAVMAVLFGSEKNPWAIARRVAALAFEHAKHLAYFAAVYKGVLVAGRILYAVAGIQALPGAPGQPAAKWHALLAGALGARLVWAPYSGLNFQIVLYLLSRVLVAACQTLARRGVQPFASVPFARAYPALAVATWAAVMYLYEADPGSLHPSLVSSMNEIYTEPAAAAAGTTAAATPVPELGASASHTAAALLRSLPLPTPTMAFVLCFLLWDVGPARFLQLLRPPTSSSAAPAAGAGPGVGAAGTRTAAAGAAVAAPPAKPTAI